MSIDDDFFDVSNAIKRDKGAIKAFERIMERYNKMESEQEDILRAVTDLSNVREALNEVAEKWAS